MLHRTQVTSLLKRPVITFIFKNKTVYIYTYIYMCAYIVYIYLKYHIKTKTGVIPEY